MADSRGLHPVGGDTSAGKRIAICHYRVGRTDGVSLEIERRKKCLEEMGHHVSLLSGPVQVGGDVIIPELEFDSPNISRIKKNAFGALEDFSTEDQLLDEITRTAEGITAQLLRIQNTEKFDMLFVHNIFSHGRHIAAARGFADFVGETGLSTVAVHHDLYRAYGSLYQTPHIKVQNYLDTYIPPDLAQIRHVTINSLDQTWISDRTGTDVMVFPDILDFDGSPWERDDYNRSLPGDLGLREDDLLLLQATRIVERKAVELAVDLAAELQKRIPVLAGKNLYNDRQLTAQSRVVLLLPGSVEPASQDYHHRLQAYCSQKGVEARFYSDRTGAQRGETADGQKRYSLWDSYVFADMITFPSIHEGWGNQFLEAVFSRRPVALFEYPVFLHDIRPEGYEYISLGNTFERLVKTGFVTVSNDLMETAADETIEWLLNPGLKAVLERNFQIGRVNHGMDVLYEKMRQLVDG